MWRIEEGFVLCGIGVAETCPTGMQNCVHGSRMESVGACAKKLAELGADYYAIGSLIEVSTEEAVKRIVKVRQILGKKVKLHIFVAIA